MQTPADSGAGALTSHLSCARCGYNLHSLPIAGLCPECGLPIDATLRTRTPLARADPLYVNRLTVAVPGLIVTQAIILIQAAHHLLFTFGWLRTLPDYWDWTVTFPSMIASTAQIVWLICAAWLFTAPDPDRDVARNEAFTARVLLRLSGIVLILLSVTPIRDFVDLISTDIWSIIYILLNLLVYITFLLYWLHLSRRAADAFLIWHVPIAVGGQIVAYLLTLFALQDFIAPRSRALGGAEMKLLALARAFFIAYQLYLLIHFRKLLMERAAQALENWRIASPAIPVEKRQLSEPLRGAQFNPTIRADGDATVMRFCGPTIFAVSAGDAPASSFRCLASASGTSVT